MIFLPIKICWIPFKDSALKWNLGNLGCLSSKFWKLYNLSWILACNVKTTTIIVTTDSEMFCSIEIVNDFPLAICQVSKSLDFATNRDKLPNLICFVPNGKSISTFPQKNYQIDTWGWLVLTNNEQSWKITFPNCCYPITKPKSFGRIWHFAELKV